MKHNTRQMRQGDVLVVAVAGLPAGAEPVVNTEKNRVVLAHGELTGHAHAVDDQGVVEFNHARAKGIVDRFLQVQSRKALGHEEHTRLPVMPGVHKVVQQREYAQRQPRPVAD